MPALGHDSSDEEDEAPKSQPAPSTPKGGMLWQKIPEDQPDFWMRPDEQSLPAPTSAPTALTPCAGITVTTIPVLKPSLPAPTSSPSALGPVLQPSYADMTIEERKAALRQFPDGHPLPSISRSKNSLAREKKWRSKK